MPFILSHAISSHSTWLIRRAPYETAYQATTEKHTNRLITATMANFTKYTVVAGGDHL
jgi:hypothetical protein